ncbi:MAG: DUF433 domain-containing protein [Boseongicola sp. SB0677_bin_26]|nr:DUF433 domain-containing protein [Boseongicola sp. SB0665_bin_10]MYG24741.1 DUF433 domain-containing protein [Boseongicola sp. SB0677_bin_26]
MTDWTNCPAVERDFRKISGDWAFEGTRVPASALFENLESGATVKELLEWRPEVRNWQVTAVPTYVAGFLRTVARE